MIFCKKAISELVSERLIEGAGAPRSAYVDDIDFVDVFSEHFQEVLGRLGPEAFYSNPYVRQNFWSIVFQGYKYFLSAVENSTATDGVICGLDFPLNPRVNTRQYFDQFDEVDMSLLDKTSSWPRFLIYRRPLVIEQVLGAYGYPVKITGRQFRKFELEGFNSIFSIENKVFSIQDVQSVLNLDTYSDSEKVKQLTIELGYYSKLVLFPKAH